MTVRRHPITGRPIASPGRAEARNLRPTGEPIDLSPVDAILEEMVAESESEPSGPLPWHHPDYHPTPEAVEAFREPPGDPQAQGQLFGDSL
jgi:hypothetical protein